MFSVLNVYVIGVLVEVVGVGFNIYFGIIFFVLFFVMGDENKVKNKIVII